MLAMDILFWELRTALWTSLLYLPLLMTSKWSPMWTCRVSGASGTSLLVKDVEAFAALQKVGDASIARMRSKYEQFITITCMPSSSFSFSAVVSRARHGSRSSRASSWSFL